MTLARLPELMCPRCGESHDVTFYEDDSIRSSTHVNCPKPVPGPPNPPRLLDKGKFWLVPTTCVECGAKEQAVTQMQSMVHKTILCMACQQQAEKQNRSRKRSTPRGKKGQVMRDIEIARRFEELKRERKELEESTTTRLQAIKAEMESLLETMKRRAAGLHEAKIALAETVIEVTGKYEREGGCIDKAIASLASGGAYMKKVAIAVKDYDRFHGQGCDCEYGYGPKHGWHVFTIGLTRDARKRDLTEDELDAAIYYLVHLRQIQEAKQHAAVA